MSDSDSSDSDDDLSSPMFAPKKQTRASFDRDKNKMSFLDSCLELEQERHDRKERMADILLQNNNTHPISESKKQTSNNQDHHEHKPSNPTESKKINDKSDPIISPNENIDARESTNTSNDHNNKIKQKIKSENLDGQGTNQQKINFENESRTKGKKSVLFKEQEKEYLLKACQKDIPNYNINDPSYWSRIEDYAEDAKNNMHEREQRRQDIHDAVEGYYDELLNASQNSFLDDEYFVASTTDDDCHSTTDNDTLSDSDTNNDQDDDNGPTSFASKKRNKPHRNNSKDTKSNNNNSKIQTKNKKRQVNIDRDKMQALLNAKITGKSSLTGVRSFLLGKYSHCEHNNTLSTSSSNNSSSLKWGLFPNSESAVNSLKELLKNLDKAPPKHIKQKEQWKLMRTNIFKPFKVAATAGYLVEFLSAGRIERCIFQNTSNKRKLKMNAHLQKRQKQKQNEENLDQINVLPKEFIQWLTKASLSGQYVGKGLADAAYTLTKNIFIYSKNNDIFEVISTEKSYDDDSTPLMTIYDMITILESEFGLWTIEGPIPESVLDTNRRKHGRSNNDNDENKKFKQLFDNPEGLYYALDLWAELMNIGFSGDNHFLCSSFTNKDISKRQQHLSEQELWNKEDNGLGSAAFLVAYLVRIGLDPVVHFEGFLPVLGRLLNCLFQSISKSYYYEKEENVCYISKLAKCPWLHFTASCAFRFCKNLSCGGINSTDKDDRQGYLSLSLAIRLWHSLGDISPAYTIFNSILAKEILNQCIGEATKIKRNELLIIKLEQVTKQLLKEPYIKSEASSDCEKPEYPNHWHLLINTEVVLEFVKNDSSGIIIENGPRFLALVEIILSCVLLGLHNYEIHTHYKSIGQGKNDDSISENDAVLYYGSTEDADVVCSYLERMEKLCRHLKQKVTCVFVYPHLRRAKELLSYLSVYCNHLKINASKLATNNGNGRLRLSIGEKSQKTLQTWFLDNSSQNTNNSMEVFISPVKEES